MFIFFVNILFLALSVILPLLLSIAVLTLLERKILGGTQKRRGPNVVGFWGILQPIADGVKLILKETTVPYHASKFWFFLAPALVFVLAVLSWFCIPFACGLSILNLDNGLLYIFALSSLGVYSVVLSGWSSGSNYPLLGSLRSAAQMISYEVCLSVIIMPVVVCTGSLNLSDIVFAQQSSWFCFILFPSFLMFGVAALAETNRTPFDLPEAEAELVSGYNVEYSSFTFALFFLAEYSHIILMSALTTICYLGGWNFPILSQFGLFWFIAKTSLITIIFIWIRATLPRYRFDQLMSLGWKSLLPLSFSFLYLTISFIFVF